MATCNDDNQVEVEVNVSGKLQSQIDEYRIDMRHFTLKEAETIVNFISTDKDDRCIRSEHVWKVDTLRTDAYWFLNKLLEKIGQSTPLSIVDQDLVVISHLIARLKGLSFEGSWLNELEGFLHENKKNTNLSVEELKCTEESRKTTSEIFQKQMEFFRSSTDRINAELQEKKAQMNEAKKARKGTVHCFPICAATEELKSV